MFLRKISIVCFLKYFDYYKLFNIRLFTFDYLISVLYFALNCCSCANTIICINLFWTSFCLSEDLFKWIHLFSENKQISLIEMFSLMFLLYTGSTIISVRRASYINTSSTICTTLERIRTPTEIYFIKTLNSKCFGFLKPQTAKKLKFIFSKFLVFYQKTFTMMFFFQGY